MDTDTSSSLPATTTLLPVVIQLCQASGIPLRALVWPLSLGVCLGANATVLGAPVNVVGMGMVGQAGYPVGFVDFIRFGAPIAGLSLVATTIYLLAATAAGYY